MVLVFLVLLFIFALWCCRDCFFDCKEFLLGWLYSTWRQRRSRAWLIAAVKRRRTSSPSNSIKRGSSSSIKHMPYLKLPGDENTDHL